GLQTSDAPRHSYRVH
ncbi:hypothetical protein, partial [Achromobacter phage kwar_LB4]